jgi:hypothetical protein
VTAFASTIFNPAKAPWANLRLHIGQALATEENLRDFANLAKEPWTPAPLSAKLEAFLARPETLAASDLVRNARVRRLTALDQDIRVVWYLVNLA